MVKDFTQENLSYSSPSNHFSFTPFPNELLPGGITTRSIPSILPPFTISPLNIHINLLIGKLSNWVKVRTFFFTYRQLATDLPVNEHSVAHWFKHPTCVGPINTNVFSFQNIYIHMRLGLSSTLIRWAFTSTTHRFENTLDRGSKWKRSPKLWQARVFVACAESSTYVTTRSAIVFLRFCLDSRKRIKSVVWTRIDLCVFDDNESEYLWKHISVDKALGSMGQSRIVKIHDLATRLWDI